MHDVLEVDDSARVDVTQHLGDDVAPNVLDNDDVLGTLLRVVLEHRGEDGAARREDSTVHVKLLAVAGDYREVAQLAVLQQGLEVVRDLEQIVADGNVEEIALGRHVVRRLAVAVLAEYRQSGVFHVAVQQLIFLVDYLLTADEPAVTPERLSCNQREQNCIYTILEKI